MKTIAKLIGILALLSMLAACGGGSNAASFTSGGGGVPVPTGPTAKSLSLGTTQTSVKSDNSNSATITATVLDASNVIVPGAKVSFSANAGQLSLASGVTDVTGKVTVVFSSGTTDPSNATATITATVAGVAAAQIPIQITGSSLSLSSSSTNLTFGGTAAQAQATVTIKAKNAGGLAVPGAAISLSTTGTGSATFTPAATGTTDVTGVYTVTVTATSIGTLTVTATGLGPTTTASLVFNITGTGSAFQITSPTANPATLQTGSSQLFTVSAPGVANVTFATSLGVWDGGTSSLVTKAVSGGTVSATLSSAQSGTATVQVFNSANPATLDSRTVLISAPSSAANNITLQSSVSAVAPSTGGSANTATLTATVKTSQATGNQPVGGAPVVFTLSNTTGGGEFVSPVYGTTDSSGRVTTTFTSGSLSSGASGVTVTATVYDSSSVAIASASQAIVINQIAGSVVIGSSTTLQDANSSTSYIMPMSVMVADANGNGVPGAVVTLSVWPAQYSTGYWTGTSACVSHVTGTFANEDVNENLILDPGEDLPYSLAYIPTLSGGKYSEDINNSFPTIDANEDLNGNGVYDLFTTDNVLTPENSAGGTLPTTVTTDANGVANFNLNYLKQRAIWIVDRFRAKTTVKGTETTGTLFMRLPVLKTDADGCFVFNSPYNPRIFP